MHNDEGHLGRLLSRRQVVALLGSASTAWATGLASRAGAQSTACVVLPEQTEGPFFRDRRLERADIRTDTTADAAKAGVPVTLAFHVGHLAAGECRPLAGAIVDVWQCDAEGAYSGVGASSSAKQQDFLRGYQRTDNDGNARFVTIYPGRYPGRTVHIHFKVRAASDHNREFTSQLYFEDALSARVHANQPYSTSAGRLVRNQDDALYRHGGGQLTLQLNATSGGYVADFPVVLDLG